MTNEETPKNRRMIVTAAAAVGAMLGAAGIAGAVVNTQTTDTTTSTATDDSTVTADSTTDATTTADNETNETHDGRGGNGETPLTGQTATDVTNAALAAVPGGTIERVENDADGAAYEAHMLDATGNPVTVTFDTNLDLIDTIAGGGGRGGEGHGGGGHDETPLTGQAADDATAAALAAVPGGTVNDVEAENHGTAAYEAHVTDADGNNVRVTLDESFAVVEITPGR